MSLGEVIFIGSRMILQTEEDLSSYSRQRTIILYKPLSGPMVSETSSVLMVHRWPSKKSHEVLDYTLDWTRLIEDGEVIVETIWSIFDEGGVKVPVNYLDSVQGLVLGRSSVKENKTTIYLANGIDNKDYKLSCEVQLNNGISLERGVKLSIKGL